uniref:Uncharacterized protein n=1 Tax=Romanomermis culicivorax TaxID=13658 RepID=A0A915IJ63_ROMCU
MKYRNCLNCLQGVTCVIRIFPENPWFWICYVFRFSIGQVMSTEHLSEDGLQPVLPAEVAPSHRGCAKMPTELRNNRCCTNGRKHKLIDFEEIRLL